MYWTMAVQVGGRSIRQVVRLWLLLRCVAARSLIDERQVVALDVFTDSAVWEAKAARRPRTCDSLSSTLTEESQICLPIASSTRKLGDRRSWHERTLSIDGARAAGMRSRKWGSSQPQARQGLSRLFDCVVSRCSAMFYLAWPHSGNNYMCNSAISTCGTLGRRDCLWQLIDSTILISAAYSMKLLITDHLDLRFRHIYCTVLGSCQGSSTNDLHACRLDICVHLLRCSLLVARASPGVGSWVSQNSQDQCYNASVSLLHSGRAR